MFAFCILRPSASAQEITFARPATTSAVTINGQQISRWQKGNFEILHVQGNVEVRQQDIFASANEAIIWVELPSDDPADFYAAAAGPQTNRVIVYLQNNVVVELDSLGAVNQRNGGRRDRIEDQQWLGQLVTQATVDLATATYPLPGNRPPAIYHHALQSAMRAGVTGVDPNAAGGNVANNRQFSQANFQTHGRNNDNSFQPTARLVSAQTGQLTQPTPCLLYTSDAADE